MFALAHIEILGADKRPGQPCPILQRKACRRPGTAQRIPHLAPSPLKHSSTADTAARGIPYGVAPHRVLLLSSSSSLVG